MKFLLLTYIDEKDWFGKPEAERQELMGDAMPHVQRLLADGKFLGGAPLLPVSTASTVRLRDGQPLITDGPYAETREQVGGYALIEAVDFEEAVRIAAGFLGTRSPSITEVRQIGELRGVPPHR